MVGNLLLAYLILAPYLDATRLSNVPVIYAMLADKGQGAGNE